MKKFLVVLFWGGLLTMAVMYAINKFAYHEHHVSRTELQDHINKKFADRDRTIEAEVGQLTYEIPRIAIADSRVAVYIEFTGEAKGLKTAIHGELKFDTQVRYDNETGDIRLVEPRLAEVRLGGLSAFGTSSLGNAIAAMFTSVLDGMSIHTLNEQEKAKLPPFVSVEKIEFEGEELIVTLKLG